MSGTCCRSCCGRCRRWAPSGLLVAFAFCALTWQNSSVRKPAPHYHHRAQEGKEEISRARQHDSYKKATTTVRRGQFPWLGATNIYVVADRPLEDVQAVFDRRVRRKGRIKPTCWFSNKRNHDTHNRCIMEIRSIGEEQLNTRTKQRGLSMSSMTNGLSGSCVWYRIRPGPRGFSLISVFVRCHEKVMLWCRERAQATWQFVSNARALNGWKKALKAPTELQSTKNSSTAASA